MSNKTLCIIGLIVWVGVARAASERERADSLFETSNYGASYEAYAQLRAQRQHQPIDLLRMAYIQEGLQQYHKVLYHLMDYYLQTQDERAWRKITQLSRGHQISGYELEEWERLCMTLLKHKDWIIGLNLLIWISWIGGCFFRRKQRLSWAVGLIMLSASLVGLMEREWWMPRRAVVLANAELREGPSGASAVEVPRLLPGTLLRIEDSNLLWTKVRWEGEKSYIRTHHLGFLHHGR